MAAEMILIIDDNPIMRKLVRVTLRGVGYAVQEAEDGRTALALAAAQPPQLILQDLTLPDIDGLALVGQLRALPGLAETPILAFSGYQGKLEQARSLQVGFTDHLFKPIEPDHLVQMVQAYLGASLPDVAPAAARPRILLADDDPRQLKLLRIHLEQAGFAVVAVTDGRKALDEARRRRPAAILSDVLMPHLDGFGLCLAIRRDPHLADLPVVLLSSIYVDAEDRLLGTRAGATAFVGRTPEAQEAIAALRTALAAAPGSSRHTVPAELPLDAYINRVVRALEHQVTLNQTFAQRLALREAELAVLASLVEALQHGTDLDRVLGELLHRCLDWLDVPAGTIYLLDTDGALVPRAHVDAAGLNTAGRAVLPPTAAALRVALDGDDVLGAPTLAEPDGGPEATALLVVPLRMGRDRLGVLVLSGLSGRFDHDWTSFATALGAQISQALQLQRALQQALAAQERQTRIVETVPDGLIILDLAGRITFANPAAEQIVTTPGGSLAGMAVADLGLQALPLEGVQPDNEGDFAQPLRAGQSVSQVERLYARPDGSIVILSLNAAPLRDTADDLTGVVIAFRDVTERTQAAERMATLARAVEQTADSVTIMDRQGVIEYVNPAFTVLTGYAPAEAIGQNPRLLKFGQPEQAVYQEMWRTITGGEVFRNVFVNTNKSGDRYYEERTVAPLVNSHGRITNFVSTGKDITDSIQAQEALRTSEERYRRIVETANEGIWIIDAQACTSFVNNRMAQMLGYTVEEMDGTSLLAYADEAGQSLAQANIERVRQGNVQQHDFKFRHRDSHGVWVRVSSTPLFDAEGAYAGMMTMAADITDWRRVQEERDRFFTISLDLLAIVSMDGYFKDLNPAFERTLGFTIAELMARPFIDFLHPDDVAATVAEVQKLATGVTTVSFENRYLCKDGSYRWLSWTAAPVPDQHLLYAVARDVTEHKEAAAALQQAHAGLEERVEARTTDLAVANASLRTAKVEAEVANLAKSEFLSRMSHELRTPLNAILGFSQVLELRDLGPQDNQGVAYILRAGRHLLQLINEVLDIARIEAGRMPLSLEAVDVARGVAEALDMIRPLAATRQVTLLNGVSAADGWHIQADHQRFKQVMLNLLSNAIKYNRDGGQVTCTCTMQEGGRLRLLVADTGAGLHPAELGRLFVHFERLGAAGTAIEGTGIGLALSRQLVEVMGGTMGVESRPGVGSTFWVELPLVAGQAAEQSVRPDGGALETNNGAALAVSEQRTVLYVEDNLSNIALIERLLNAGRKVRLLTALQGSLGLELAQQHIPDLILLDIHLPDMQGDEVLRRLQADPRTRDIPVVVLSADARPSAITRLREAGAAAYLTKPIDVPLFLSTIQRLLIAH